AGTLTRASRPSSTTSSGKPPAASCVCPPYQQRSVEGATIAMMRAAIEFTTNLARRLARALKAGADQPPHHREVQGICQPPCRSPGRRYLADPLFGPFAQHRVAVTRRVQGANCQRPPEGSLDVSLLPHSGTTCPPS